MNSIADFPFPRLPVLSENDIQEIHETSLRILEDVGILIRNQKALNLLAEAGANVDYDSKLVKLSKSLVDQARMSAPSRIDHRGLLPEKDMLYDAKGGFIGRPISGVNRILDAGSRQPRPTTV